jgi:diguanylate cyclase (GGDEF)-like protein
MKTSKNRGKSLDYGYIILAVFSIFALASTFTVSNADLTFSVKSAAFALIIVIYTISAFVIYFRQRRGARNSDSGIFSSEREEKLLILEEASEFFSSSLKLADMFRLVSSRVNEIIPFSACVLFLVDEDRAHLKTVCASGENKEFFKDLRINLADGLAGKSVCENKPQTDKKLFADRKAFSPDALKNLKSAAAVPLRTGGEVFGALQLFGASENDFDKDSLILLEAIGERVAPLFSGSMAFERSLSRAMTDALTDLPNERAFYLMLENQIAEAQRLPEKRKLTVLVTDIKDFTELNQKYGHATGDKILAFAAKLIKTQLRQMDFLSRSMNDEFFAVLPTANEEITETIIKRIERVFVLQPFEIAGEEKVYLKLNFGAASFLDDSETANQLLQTALLRKHQGKSAETNKIIWFPKQYVN